MPQAVILDLTYARADTANRKAGHLTSIIRVMATIRSSVMTESLVI